MVVIILRIYMEDYFIYIIVILALFFIFQKTFGKNSDCGCGGKGKCSKK
jgi:hypothetical protein